MKHTPKGVSPPSTSTHAPAETGAAPQKGDWIINSHTAAATAILSEMAVAISPYGQVRPFVPKEPRWCREIGRPFRLKLEAGIKLKKHDQERLRKTYQYALARQEQAQQQSKSRPLPRASLLNMTPPRGRALLFDKVISRATGKATWRSKDVSLFHGAVTAETAGSA